VRKIFAIDSEVRVGVSLGISGNEPTDKIQELLRRQAVLRSAISEERVRQQKRVERDLNRLALILGSALIREGEDSPEFRDMLIRILRGSDLSESDRHFLVKKGWL
jgi:hypothetical protein